VRTGIAAPEDKTEEAAAVREQLERLLGSSHFNHSRRFPSFLRFVVDHALKGQTDLLKERTLGIEVFGRGAEYDTASDPIVRVTAAEIRKRLAQYYDEAGHERELRISLPPGSYIPEFRLPSEARTEPSAEPRDSDSQAADRSKGVFRWLSLAVAGIVLLSAGVGAGLLWQSPRRSSMDYFWGPVLRSSDPVLMCVADQSQYSTIALRDAADPSRVSLLKDNLTAVVIDDLNTVARIAGVLQSNGKQYNLRGENATSLNDLRTGATVVVGAFDNEWTLRLTKQLRYRFDNDAAMTQLRIVDTAAPSHAPWTVVRSQQISTNNYKDYAIVARFIDPTTGKLTIVVAGIARGGTIVAGEFLTNPSDLDEIERAARAAGNKTNMEFVLSTQIIDGDPGIPRMEASYFW
jgi:hypothetical protein